MLLAFMLLTFGADHSGWFIDDYRPVLCIGVIIVVVLLSVAFTFDIVMEQAKNKGRKDIKIVVKSLRIVAWIVAISFVVARYLLR